MRGGLKEAPAYSGPYLGDLVAVPNVLPILSHIPAEQVRASHGLRAGPRSVEASAEWAGLTRAILRNVQALKEWSAGRPATG